MTSKKKTKLWNKIIILIITALVIFTFTSQESGFAARLYTEGVQENSSNKLQGEQGRIKRVKATLDEIILETQIEDLSFFEREVDGLVFTQLSLPFSGITEEIGKPELPSFGQFFAVPNGAQMKVEVLEVEYETIPDVLVYPTQEPLPDCATMDENGQDARPFAFDRDFYALEVDYPGQVITVDPVTSIRGVHASVAHFFPVQYNPRLKELTVYSYIKVRISFTGGSRSIGDLSKRAKAFEGIYSNLLINYDSLEQVDFKAINAENRGGSGVQFLIITAPDFETAANLLAAHRQTQGITTVVVTTDVTGSTSSNIQEYIKNAYDTWDVPLEYVLLLGDAEYIPTNYITGHPYHDDELIGTDLYYATVDGTDYDADILLGRISVDSSTQATDRINRIINYPAAGTHYDKIALAAYFQDYNNYDGYEDRRFVLTSEEIRDYLLTQSYDVQRIYNTDSDVTPTNWSTTYGDGSPIPAELLRSNGFAWDGDAADITSKVNDGVLILQHRDHGARWGWGDPYYTDSNVNALTNGDKQPVVFSMNCQTGWFDNETDENSGTTASTSIFSEAWERNPNGGAVGIVAATRVSYSGYNDYLTLGMYDAIWPNFLPYNNTSFDRPEYRVSAVLNYGKLAMRTLWSGSSTYNLIETEMFHYFGDPTMYLGEFGPSQPLQNKTFLPLVMQGLSAGFDSQFNGDADGWIAHSGSWYYDDNYLWTEGIIGTSSSVSYTEDFTNFDYQVRMWRYGNDGDANRIMVRGLPDPLFSYNHWNCSYFFQYSRNGTFSIWKELSDGSVTALQDWVMSSAINTGDAWNTLRVVGNGSNLYFYINDSLVWSGTDSSLSSGRVGIGMYRGDDGVEDDVLYIDWATLTTSSVITEIADKISPEQQILNDEANRTRSTNIDSCDIVP
ncbi:MAG: C25 family cysteine peptidase [Desulfopila sp.]|jgi:hypothetical protein|nr:C25 family cysteine peptidase [Desulfopila sp.]